MTALAPIPHRAVRRSSGRRVPRRVLSIALMGLLAPLFVLATLVTLALGRLNRVGADGGWDPDARTAPLWS